MPDTAPTAEELRWHGHEREHQLDEELRWQAHAREHELLAEALDAALAAVNRENAVHAAAHTREHELTSMALDKAEANTEHRFASVNEFREQLRAQAAGFASRESVETLSRIVDRRSDDATKVTTEKLAALERANGERFESNRSRIEALEKGDVKQEGKGAGQAAVIAGIALAVSVAGGILGLIVLISNALHNAAT